MISDELLAEIERTCAEARFGYGSVTIHAYYRHVSALLADRKALLAEAESLRAELVKCAADGNAAALGESQ